MAKENILNVTNRHRNTNQNHRERLPYTTLYGHYQQKMTSVGKDVEILESFCAINEKCEMLQLLGKIVW